jgi:hypothetical protein
MKIAKDRSKFDIEAALKEVQEKTIAEIEEETAYKWASRSYSCYELYKDTEELKWLLRAEEYFNEAVEHGALVHDSGVTLKIIEDKLKEIRDKFVEK